MLACEDRECYSDGWRGIVSLGVLKGDVDNLGAIFRDALHEPTFAKWASLSRQLNAFFALYLPWRLRHDRTGRFGKVYTVFAGGDDFFLIGPWRTLQILGAELRKAFRDYVAQNPELHFSAGIVSQKPGAPVDVLARLADAALDAAKSAEGKDAVCCFGEVVRWSDWPKVEEALTSLDDLHQRYELSTGYVYGLLQFVDQHAPAAGRAARIEDSIWRARFRYRTVRLLEQRLPGDRKEARATGFQDIVRAVGDNGIQRLGRAYRVALFDHLYRHRQK
jgi:CRISPR-associated protein Csm1